MEGGRAAPLLHGTLEAVINDAALPAIYTVCTHRVYVTISLGTTTMAETTREKNPTWNQTFRILCAHPAETEVVVTVRTTFWVVGRARIPASRLLGHGQPPCDGTSFSLLAGAALGKGLCDGQFGGLHDGVTFPQRHNCGVVLYQDAHHRRGFAPPLLDGQGRGLRARRLWEDIYAAIDGAKHIIYITGWAFNHSVVLVQDPDTERPDAVGVELGELLKRKADEGVAVRLMLWDDESSLPLIRNPGLMRTHDEDSFTYFAQTRVVCRRFPRLHHNFPTVFAHHQKTISVDSPRRLDGDSGREIVSFVGGLDLYDGRYDTEEHSLFRNLDAGEFYQVSIAGAGRRHGGPREPWHDVHCRLTGSAAYDVLANFEQRWTKQSDPSLLLPRDAFPGFQAPAGEVAEGEEDDWNVQVFRSIDGLSSTRLPEQRTAEHSIHEAYVSAIRRAERFIYIENQYFLGGSSLWEGDRGSGCENLVPAEIALKIAAKIRAGERFAAYVVVPMWPEGRTMAMMYSVVGEAIREKGIKEHPREYLSFFCLAKREPRPPEGEHLPARNRRFMIYVHSKLMIVDDEYLLMGSANVNQRSMDGGRDTEIAHTGAVRDAFRQPEGPACARELNDVGDAAWRSYSGEAAADMAGVHLVSYPVAVSPDGRLHDGGSFPDTKAPVKGKRHWWFPPVFTT
ncbi:unnamed protein product [Spirodela intermedia]|uniref:phospholipase D n=1 Tax=Spirodela intermedia TaxID=51605 RepID=A0A7I8JCW9_SPIIN|nr:unnamed protein product [Spirodela intermedia]CAA6667987.1 unnamed protein product [Spirodela intermedia]